MSISPFLRTCGSSMWHGLCVLGTVVALAIPVVLPAFLLATALFAAAMVGEAAQETEAFAGVTWDMVMPALRAWFIQLGVVPIMFMIIGLGVGLTIACMVVGMFLSGLDCWVSGRAWNIILASCASADETAASKAGQGCCGTPLT